MVTDIQFAAGLVLLVCIPLGDGHCQDRSHNKAVTQTSTADQKRFEELTAGDCRQIFLDPCTQDWQDQWFLDGKKATITSSETGMDFLAGPTALDDSCHAVLWTKQSFCGDLKIEYEYTRLDTAVRYVNILYVQATGSGKEDFKKDILQWSQFRTVPAMRKYFDHMNTYHISYAAFGMQNDDAQQDYIRARRYRASCFPVGVNGDTQLSSRLNRFVECVEKPRFMTLVGPPFQNLLTTGLLRRLGILTAVCDNFASTQE